MFEDYEGINSPLENVGDSQSIYDRMEITPDELRYVAEVIPLGESEILASRIDELSGTVPPKAIDSNMSIAAMLEPIKDGLDPLYLEAPSDHEQVLEIADAMEGIEGLQFDKWRDMTMDERLDTINELEQTVSDIAHRPSCPVELREMGDKTAGFYNYETKTLVINSSYIESSSPESFSETIKTVIHEGRHAYQDYNINEREVHAKEYEIAAWKNNWNYYLDAERFGFEKYAKQPVEADAFAFESDVFNQYLKRA